MVHFSLFMSGLANHLITASRSTCQHSRVSALAFVMIALAGLPAHSQDMDEAEAYSALEGLRYGISVTDLDGNILVEHRAHERFMPASNIKLFVTATALAAETELSALDASLKVELEQAAVGPPNLVLMGRGDPTIGFGSNCNTRCIETLAKTVAETGIAEIGDVVGDDRWFADERKPLGWSWDDLKFSHGTAISALAVNENVVPLRVSPSSKPGADAKAFWLGSGPTYFDLHNEAKTTDAEDVRALRLERRLGTRVARLYGELPAGSRALTLDLAVDDPAHLAAWSFRKALEAEGVAVSGELRTRHRPLQYSDEPKSIDQNDPDAPLKCSVDKTYTRNETIIASLEPVPLQDVVAKINLDSQNLYAEVLLRQLGRAAGNGSSFCGLLQIQELLDQIGVTRTSYDIADGSGLSNYNRATPATITALLRYAAAAPWGYAYRASLPVGGGSQGTLRYRFRDTALEGKVFAKTGTLNHVDALSGYMQAKSGKTLVFSIIVNDRPLETPSAIPQIDSLLLEIAARH